MHSGFSFKRFTLKETKPNHSVFSFWMLPRTTNKVKGSLYCVTAYLQNSVLGSWRPWGSKSNAVVGDVVLRQKSTGGRVCDARFLSSLPGNFTCLAYFHNFLEFCIWNLKDSYHSKQYFNQRRTQLKRFIFQKDKLLKLCDEYMGFTVLLSVLFVGL